MPSYEDLAALAEQHDATLVAVSKTKPVSAIRALYDRGHRDFGENYVQELVEKRAELPDDIRWHFIGHLQRNKVKDLVGFVHLVHGVDSLRLLRELDKRARAIGRIVDVLLQVHVAEEETKFGFEPHDVIQLMEADEIHRLAWVRPSGIMGMTTLTDDRDQQTREFATLKSLYDEVKERFYARRPAWNTLSMGMSGDYEAALEQGSNCLRIGSLLFGPRE